MFVENKTKLQIEQGKVENLLKGFKAKVTGDVARCLRSVLGTQAIMRIESSSDSIEKLTGAQYSILVGNKLVWVDGVAFSDTEFVGVAVSREMVAKCAYMYAGGDKGKIADMVFDLEKPISILEESFVSHLSSQLLAKFNNEVLGDQPMGIDDEYPRHLSGVELSLDAIRDVYIDEMVFNVDGVELKVNIVSTKAMLSKLGDSVATGNESLDDVVKRNVEINVGAFYACETMLLEEVTSLEVGDCIPLVEKPTGGLKACLKSGDVELSSNGVIGTNSADQIIFKCN